MNFAEFLLEYKGEHSAPTKDEASLDDLTKNGVYPDDVYTHPKYYVNDNTDQECYNIAIACKGQPNKSVRIYRAVPLGDKKWTEKELAKAEKDKFNFRKRGKTPSDYTGKQNEFYGYITDKIEELEKKLADMGDDEKLKINEGIAASSRCLQGQFKHAVDWYMRAHLPVTK